MIRSVDIMQFLLAALLLTAPVSSDYHDLQAALAQQDFRLADRITHHHIDRLVNSLPTVENTTYDPFSAGHRQIPCADLKAIDKLWRTASGDRFGFMSQAQRWKKVQSNSTPEQSFLHYVHTVGWLPKVDRDWGKTYRISEELTYELTATVGHLPAVGVWDAVRWSPEVFGEAFLDAASRDKIVGRVENLMPRVLACRLDVASGLSSPEPQFVSVTNYSH